MWGKKKKKENPEILSQIVEEQRDENSKEENNAYERQAKGNSVFRCSGRGSKMIRVTTVIKDMIEENFLWLNI